MPMMTRQDTGREGTECFVFYNFDICLNLFTDIYILLSPLVMLMLVLFIVQAQINNTNFFPKSEQLKLCLIKQLIKS